MDRLRKTRLLYQVVERFAGFDLSPSAAPPHEMGLAFEELIRRFADAANNTAGEQFTPRDAIKPMVSILFAEDHDVLTPGTNVVRTIHDPAAGTGGMLSEAENYLRGFNPQATLTMFGQELNEESYAICKADMLIKGQDVRNIVVGNTLSEDGHPGREFDYMLSNPPFGVEWKKIEKPVRAEHEQLGHAGRFGPGLPRVSDGSMLFLLHLLSKMRPAKDGGSRIGIVLNGSPLFTGGAGSGESEIRRYVMQNDLLEAIIALPTDMFFNTGIATYVWILSNRRPWRHRGRQQERRSAGRGRNGVRLPRRGEERVEPRRYADPPFPQEVPIVFDPEQVVLGRDGLGLERHRPELLEQGGQIGRWRLVADRPVRPAANEREVCYVVGLPKDGGLLEDGLREDVVELQPVLGPRVVERDGEVRAPVLCTGGAEGEEHGFEERAPDIPSLEFLGRHVEAADLLAKPFDEFGRAAALAQRREILVKQRLARAP